jgi:hypothetical protein
MNKELAVSALKESFSRGSSTPSTWAADREAYITEKCSELLDAVIEPALASISAETYNYGVKQELEAAHVYAVARSGTNWLVYSPAAGRFCLAFGEGPDNLTILGFSSSDALADWLG